MKRFHLGQTVLELVIASSVFLMTSSSLITLITGGRALVTDTQNALAASAYAKEGVEAVRLIRNQGWSNLQNGTFGLSQVANNWQFSGSSDTKGTFTRRLTITPRSANSKNVTSAITWTGLHNRPLAVSLNIILTNWSVTQASNYIEGNWKVPLSAGTADIAIGAAGTDVKGLNNRVYLSASAANQSKPDLAIFDVTNPNNPINNSSVDLGVSNISMIAVSGNYLYGSLAGGSTDELIIVNVSNPALPVVVRRLDLCACRALSLEVSGNTLYVGMEVLSGAPEFYALNVTDPANPTVLGSLEINGNVNNMTIFNQRAYLATSVDNEELMVIDVSSPASMTKLGSYNAADTTDGYSVFVKDEFNVYLGRKLSDTAPEFFILNAFNPAAITLLGSAGMAAGINDMVAVNRLMFMVTEEPNAEFQVLDIANPASINIDYGTLNFPQAATGITYENNTIYISVRSNNALRIIRPTF